MILEDITFIFNAVNTDNCVMYLEYKSSLGEYVNATKKIGLDNLDDLQLNRYKLYNDLINGIDYGENKLLINPDFIPYNSGIIGLPYNKAFLLEEVKKMCSFFYDKYRDVCSEEIAFSIIFSQNNCLLHRNHNKSIYHYFSPKRKFGRLLVGYYYNCLSQEDELGLTKLIESFGLKNIIDTFNVKLKNKFEIDALVNFILEITGDEDNRFKIPNKPNSNDDKDKIYYIKYYKKYFKLLKHV